MGKNVVLVIDGCAVLFSALLSILKAKSTFPWPQQYEAMGSFMSTLALLLTLIGVFASVLAQLAAVFPKIFHRVSTKELQLMQFVGTHCVALAFFAFAIQRAVH